MIRPADSNERALAAQPNKNFIVKAPAGSGKTELLTQRFLNLLVTVQEPESIVALTFTKKAAAEMKERIMHSLQQAASPPTELSPHKKYTLDLATAVLKHSEDKGWNILHYPNRLQIQTIDSLSSRLAKSNPILSESGGQFNLTDDPMLLYVKAARRLLTYIKEEENPWLEPLEEIIEHLDVNLYRVERLFVEILQKREQWLPYLLTDALDSKLIKTLEVLVIQTITRLNEIDSDTLVDWITLAHYASNYVDTPLLDAQDNSDTLLQPTKLSCWQAMTQLLLKLDGNYRKRFTVKEGFPAQSQFKDKAEKAYHKSMKDKMIALVDVFEESPTYSETLLELKRCPQVADFKSIRSLLNALSRILPILIAELKLVFQEENLIDFSELTWLAQNALGDDANVGELQLKLDYKLHHLLIDEFQDTSLSQYRLLEKLVEGWEPGDGRTIFFVGDPMQSIYRFRQAEVGLFLLVQEKGFAQLPVTPLNLQANFRSSDTIVEWVNHHFKQIFPKKPCLHLGSVTFNPSQPIIQNEGNVSIRCFLDPFEEAHYIAQVLKKFIQETPEKTAAVLTRSRTHVQVLAQVLKSERIPFRAAELEHIASYILIDDLYQLTRVLLFPDDSIAWLTLLRGPYGGLPLSTLQKLMAEPSDDWAQTTLEQLKNLSLNPSECVRLEHLLLVISSSRRLIKQMPLAELVQTTWLAIGGEAALKDPLNEHKVAETYFSQLEKVLHPFEPESMERFYETFDNRYIDEVSSTPSGLSIMTIHKSKGLEFDLVIIPQMAKRSGMIQTPIMRWSEFTDDSGNSHFLLAPIKNHSDDAEPIHDYLAEIERIKSEHELKRLFYVAVTRAKSQLLLTASDSRMEDLEAYRPSKDTLLGLIFPYLKLCPPEPYQDLGENTPDSINLQLRRLPLDYLNTLPKQVRPDLALPAESNQSPLFQSWHTVAGTIVHRIFAELFKHERDPTSPGNAVERYGPLIEKLLNEALFHKDEIDAASQLVKIAIQNTFQCQSGQWLLSQRNLVQTECPLVRTRDTQMKLEVIDLTFVDEFDNRWIIDHKIIQNSSNRQFDKDSIKRKYHKQLLEYAETFAILDERPINLGLYLPIQATLIEWSYEPKTYSKLN